MTATRGRGRPRKTESAAMTEVDPVQRLIEEAHDVAARKYLELISTGSTPAAEVTPLTADDIDADAVRRIEQVTGRLSHAWGYVDPREIIAASINEGRARSWKQ